VFYSISCFCNFQAHWTFTTTVCCNSLATYFLYNTS